MARNGLQAIADSLNDTVVWCAQRADAAKPAYCLRSAALSPYDPTRGSYLAYADRDLVERPFETVTTTIQARRNALSLASRSPIPNDGGRLLGYEPDWTLASGATELSSDGFFNVVDTPPWDTWVAWIVEANDARPLPDRSKYVLCWIPRIFVQITDRAIWVNDADSLWWLDASERPLRQDLMEAGIVA